MCVDPGGPGRGGTGRIHHHQRAADPSQGQHVGGAQPGLAGQTGGEEKGEVRERERERSEREREGEE